MDGPEIIAARLKTLRWALRFDQAKKWCEFVEIPENSWNHFERGRRPITVEFAVKVADKSKVTLDWIYRGHVQGLQNEVLKKRLKDLEVEGLPVEANGKNSEEATAGADAPPNGLDDEGLTIAEAKQRLARSLGVSPSSIKIIIEA